MTKRCCLITRPIQQQKTLTDLLCAAGFNTEAFPCLSIAPHSHTNPDLTDTDLVIFTSENAVNFFIHPIKGHCTAIGPNTAAALKAKSINSHIPSTHNSEGVLADNIFQTVKEKRIVIITGKNPTPLLADGLAKRGANVLVVASYQRTCPSYSAETLNNLTQRTFAAIIFTASSALVNAQSLLSDHTEWFLQQPILVTSESQYQLAKQLNFPVILRANHPSGESIVKTLVDYY